MAAYLDHHPYPASATLLVQSGPMTGSQIQVPESGLVLGRAAGSAGSAGSLGDDPALSRRHARLDIVDDQLVVEDVGSSNGTFLNRQRISGRRPVQPGDVVTLGTSRLQVLAAPTATPPQSRPLAATTVLRPAGQQWPRRLRGSSGRRLRGSSGRRLRGSSGRRLRGSSDPLYPVRWLLRRGIETLTDRQVARRAGRR